MTSSKRFRWFVKNGATFMCLLTTIQGNSGTSNGHCPLHQWNGLDGGTLKQDGNKDQTPVQPSAAFLVPVGTTVSYRCNIDSDSDQYRWINYIEEIVYPTPNYTCLANGTWSEKPPICVDRTSVEFDYFDALQPSCHYCTDRSCAKTKNWTVIGERQAQRSANKYDHVETQHVMCTFDRPVYVGPVTFVMFGNATNPLLASAIMKVNPKDVVHHYSDEAAMFQEKYCSTLRKAHENLGNTYRAVIYNTGAFTDKVYIAFDFWTGEKHSCNNTRSNRCTGKPAPIFYSIPSLTGNHQLHVDVTSPTTTPVPVSLSLENGSRSSRANGEQTLTTTTPQGDGTEKFHFDVGLIIGLSCSTVVFLVIIIPIIYHFFFKKRGRYYSPIFTI